MNRIPVARTLLCLLGVLCLFANISTAQEDTTLTTPPNISVPLVVTGDTLFSIRGGLGPFSAADRVKALAEKLAWLFESDSLSTDSIRVQDAGNMTNIVAGSTVLLAVTEEDALAEGISRAELASKRAALIRTAVQSVRELQSPRTMWMNLGLALLILIAAVVVFRVFMKIFPKLYAVVQGWEGTLIRSVRIRGREILSANSVLIAFLALLKGIRLALSLAVFYFAVTYIFVLIPWTRDLNIQPVLSGVLLSVLLSAAALVLWKLIGAVHRLGTAKLSAWKGTLIQPIRIQTVEVLSEDRIAQILAGVVSVLRYAAYIVLAYFYITFLFSFFAFTQTWAGTLFEYVAEPLRSVLTSFIGFLPKAVFIVIIAFVTRFILKVIRAIFLEMERGVIKFGGFHADWAMPTYKIARFLIIAFAAVVIFPYLPGSDSDAFKGISVFLGILFSLGSAGAVSNMVAGVVLTYMRPFKVGDRVKIGETVGDVSERTLLVTRVQTTKNVDVTIPNAQVLNAHIINYTSLAKERGVVLHTTVTIGYDVPWRTVHELLIAAARATTNIQAEPAPFVLQTSLNDFYVSYELNASTDQPGAMPRTYSELHQNIQDKFNEAGVEIMSPHYEARRDGNEPTIPKSYRKQQNTPGS